MRVYVPASPALLGEYAESGIVPAGERLIATEESEEAEYDALCAAAEASAGLAGSSGRRLVIVADVPDPDAAFSLDRIRAVHADTEDLDLSADPDDLPELGWFATQEIPDLL